jgi:Tol biopolymer transport system component
MKKILLLLLISALGMTSCRESFIETPPDDTGTGTSELHDILYAKAESGSSWLIATMKADGSSPHDLLRLSDNVLFLSKPARDKYLYYNYQSSFPPPTKISLMLATIDSTDRRLVKEINNLEAASLSPDATKILYTIQTQSKHELHVMNIDGTSDVMLAKDIEDGFLPAFSPDGSRVAFVSTDRKGGPGNHKDSLIVVNIDGTRRIKLLDDHDEFDNKTLSWSPDGKQILIIIKDKNKYEMMLVNTDGSGKRELYEEEDGILSAASFSPDGSKIVCTRLEYGKVSIALMSASNDYYEILYTDPSCELKYPTFSNDGKHILFVAEDNRGIPPDSAGTHDMKLLDITTKTTQVLSSQAYIAHWKR